MDKLYAIADCYNFSKSIIYRIEIYLGNITIFFCKYKSHHNFACELIEYPI